jgi:hypothetical protein
MYERAGLAFPDTPAMALHRGRIDLLERHLNEAPALLNRTFAHREIYPAKMGCGDPARHGYRGVTALSWGRRFHAAIFVSVPAMQLIEAAGGAE